MSVAAMGRAARENVQKASNTVMLSAVPLTVTVNDIKALSHKAARLGPQTDTSNSIVPRDSSTSSLAAGISSVEFIRTPLLNMSGKVVVKFKNKELAREFVDTAHGKMMGGNRITAQIGAKTRQYPAPSIQLLADFQKRSPGRIVMLRGIPSYVYAGDLLKILKSNYKLAEDTVTIDGMERHWAVRWVPEMHTKSSVSSYLIRMQTVADAMLLVSRWHRTIWAPKNVARQAAWTERDRPDDGEDEEYRMPAEMLQEPTADWRGKLRGDQTAQKREPEDSADTIRSIIDAYIMSETMVYIES